jgi:corrinoid protein of di/trimethylamine methyltransferase
MTKPILEEISAAMQKGNRKLVQELANSALAEGLSASEILQDGLMAAMNVVGAKFKANEVFVPEVLIASRAMAAGIEVLKPGLASDSSEQVGTIVLGTVKGDLHDIGKNLVKIMMAGKGIDVVDIGVDVAPAKFIEAAKEHKAALIACSALLTTTMGQMQDIVDLRKADPELDPRVKVIIGGAPVTEQFREKIGADLYAEDAATAAEVALANMFTY